LPGVPVCADGEDVVGRDGRADRVLLPLWVAGYRAPGVGARRRAGGVAEGRGAAAPGSTSTPERVAQVSPQVTDGCALVRLCAGVRGAGDDGEATELPAEPPDASAACTRHQTRFGPTHTARIARRSPNGVTNMSHVEAARQFSWWCELCEKMHPIGEHTKPDLSWPPAPAQPLRPVGRDSDDIYRCDCGFHLFADASKDNEAAARHRAHTAAFRQEHSSTSTARSAPTTVTVARRKGRAPAARSHASATGQTVARYAKSAEPRHERRPARRVAQSTGSQGEGRPQVARQAHWDSPP